MRGGGARSAQPDRPQRRARRCRYTSASRRGAPGPSLVPRARRLARRSHLCEFLRRADPEYGGRSQPSPTHVSSRSTRDRTHPSRRRGCRVQPDQAPGGVAAPRRSVRARERRSPSPRSTGRPQRPLPQLRSLRAPPACPTAAESDNRPSAARTWSSRSGCAGRRNRARAPVREDRHASREGRRLFAPRRSLQPRRSVRRAQRRRTQCDRAGQSSVLVRR